MASSFPTPPFNPNIPVITPEGGTSVAYKDPNSPESLMRNVATINAQAIIDRKFDSNAPTHESFISSNTYEYYSIYILVLLFFIFFFYKSIKKIISLNLVLIGTFIFVVLFLYGRK